MNWMFGDDEEEATEPHTVGSPGYSQPDVKKPFGLRLMRPQPSYRGNPQLHQRILTLIWEQVLVPINHQQVYN